MMRTSDKGTQYGVPVRGKEASTRAARGRVCIEPTCDTVLSTYNTALTCWMHDVPHTRPAYGSKTRG